jgi:tRNA(Ile)-lysidine synthase
MSAAEPFKTGGPIVVAVSGGADSVALLTLLTDWASAKQVSLTALTVDHGLRAESGAEAALVGRWCAEMGTFHDILCWKGDKPARGIQEAARRARYALLVDWCVRHGAGDLLVAHTENDQAETFLFRMSRGSGPDGLAAMPLVSCREGIRIVRPLLTVGRARMEATLRASGRTWVDDPGNADQRYTRVRIRERLAKLEAQGIGPKSIAGTARVFGRLRAAREQRIADLADNIVNLYPEGYAVIDRAGLFAADPGISAAMVSALITQIGGREFAPKRARSARLFELLIDRDRTGTRTLGNCIVSVSEAEISLCREYGTISDKIAVSRSSRAVWDNRFLIDLKPSNAPPDSFISGLGRDGWQSIAPKISDDNQRIPSRVRYGLPAIRRGADILEVWHLGFRSPHILENIIENAVCRPRSPIWGSPFWVA